MKTFAITLAAITGLGLGVVTYAATEAWIDASKARPTYCITLPVTHALPTGGRLCSQDITILDRY